MAKKSKDSGMVGAIKGGVSIISDIIMGSVFPMLHEQTGQFMDRMEKRANEMQERIVRRIAVSIVNGLGIVFLLFALFYYLVEFRGIERTYVFLVLGVAMIVIAFILKYQMLKQERR